MANRTTVKSNILTKNVPTVTNAILSDILNTELADNLVFGEDVAVSQSSGSTNITVDFTDRDRVDLTRTGGSLNITLSGIGDGETKFLLITKTSGQEVTFVGVTDVTPIKANANALSVVLYEIVRKSSQYFAKAWVENVKTATETIEGVLEIATAAEANALTVDNKIITPAKLPTSSTSQKGVVELATATEANALTDTTRPVTPGTIPTASETQKGIIEVATAAQNDAGTAGNLAVIASELKRTVDAVNTPDIKWRVKGSIDINGAATQSGGDLTITGAKLATGEYQVTHNLGSTAYFIVINVTRTDGSGSQNKIASIYRSANYFKFNTANDSSADDAYTEFVLFQFI